MGLNPSAIKGFLPRNFRYSELVQSSRYGIWTLFKCELYNESFAHVPQITIKSLLKDLLVQTQSRFELLVPRILSARRVRLSTFLSLIFLVHMNVYRWTRVSGSSSSSLSRLLSKVERDILIIRWKRKRMFSVDAVVSKKFLPAAAQTVLRNRRRRWRRRRSNNWSPSLLEAVISSSAFVMCWCCCCRCLCCWFWAKILESFFFCFVLLLLRVCVFRFFSNFFIR